MQASHGSAKGLMLTQPRSLAGRSLHQTCPAIRHRRQEHRAVRPQIRATVSTEKPPAPQSEVMVCPSMYDLACAVPQRGTQCMACASTTHPEILPWAGILFQKQPARQ